MTFFNNFQFIITVRLFLVIAAVLVCIDGQAIVFVCDYTNPATGYTCTINGAIYNGFNEHSTISISGNHMQGFTHDSVTRVVFLNSFIPYLPNGLFAQFRNLAALHMDNVGLNRLVRDSFVNANNINLLNVDRNNIQDIAADTFLNAGTLRDLWMSYNRIEFIDSTAFRHTLRLVSIHMRGNQISSIHRDTFESLWNLEELLLQENRIGSLERFLFFNNWMLRTISLQNNRISHIGNNLFNSLSTLETLRLSGNICVNRDFLGIRNVATEVMPLLSDCMLVT